VKKTLGAQISHMLRARGIDVVFGIPGVHNQELYRGIEEAGITHVLARHEQGAGFMADGYARATGRPGVAFVISGPGLCNIMTPMGQAYSDSVPLLVISSCLDDVSSKAGQLHQMKDQRAAAETVCDWSEEAQTAADAYALIDRALAEFETSRARPKHIQVPLSLLQAPADPVGPVAASESAQVFEPETASQAVAMLKAARKPVVIFGGGAVQAAAQCATIAERLGAAVFCTYAGRGIIASTHPLYLGSTLARPGSAALLAEADLVLVVGSELAEVDLWRETPGHDCPTVRIDWDGTASERQTGPQDLLLSTDVRQVLPFLCDALQGHAPQTHWTASEIAEARARWRAEVDAERPGIVPVCDALQAVLPDDTMIYSDMTQFAYAAKEVWDMPRPGHWHHPTGFGTLGYATPAAIGGALARKGKPTFALIGDYGFHYTMQELGVAVELGLSLPILLWDNGKLKEIEDSMTRAQIGPNAVTARNPDFGKLAEAFGATAVAPADLAELQEAVIAAFDRSGPTLIHVRPEIAR
jgi:acetolactate synthase-1/2/3 large subunit/5-guanidino-2-oxopentanoate decarboxylase